MVLSNAERQALYRKRLKAAAEAAQISDAKAELLREFRRRIVRSREQIELMREGRFGLYERFGDGTRADLTAQAIEDAERAISEYDRLLALYDPEGLTAFEIEE